MSATSADRWQKSVREAVAPFLISVWEECSCYHLAASSATWSCGSPTSALFNRHALLATPSSHAAIVATEKHSSSMDQSLNTTPRGHTRNKSATKGECHKFGCPLASSQISRGKVSLVKLEPLGNALSEERAPRPQYHHFLIPGISH